MYFVNINCLATYVYIVWVARNVIILLGVNLSNTFNVVRCTEGANTANKGF